MVLFLVLILLPVAVAWIHYLAVGLPEVPVIPQQPPELANDRDGFPAWLRITHYVNFLFIILPPPQRTIHSDGPSSTLLERSLHARIGVDAIHPSRGPHESSLYGEGRRPLHFALARSARLPTYHWYGPALALALCLFWFLNGLAFVVLLFGNDQWKGLVPASWQIVPDAWAVFVHDATFHMPVKPDGYSYNALQQLSYFTAVFVMASLMAVTGLAMSPTIDNRFPWYPKMFGGRSRRGPFTSCLRWATSGS